MDERMNDNKMVTIDEQHLKWLEKKANDCDYYRGRVDGLEYVIDALEVVLKHSRVQDGLGG